MRTTRRTLVLAASACALLLAGCTTSISGTGTPLSAGSPSPTGSSSGGFPSTDSSSGSSSGSPTSTTTQTADDLAGMLMSLPSGATEWTTDWAKNTTPSDHDYAEAGYKAEYVDEVTQALEDLNTRAIAHRTWDLTAGNYSADDILFLFDDEDGAQAWFDHFTTSEDSSDEQPISVDGAKAYEIQPSTDNHQVFSIIYVAVGNIGYELDYWSPDTYNPDKAVEWMNTQIAKLK